MDGFTPVETNGLHWLSEISPVVAMYGGFSAIARDRVLGMGGLVPIHADRLVAWAALSQCNSRREVLRLTRFVQAYLDAQTAARLEMTVRFDDLRSHQWARILGFHPEGPEMPFFNRDGSSAQMYVRFRDG